MTPRSGLNLVFGVPEPLLRVLARVLMPDLSWAQAPLDFLQATQPLPAKTIKTLEANTV